MKKYLSRLTFALVVALVASLGVAIPAMGAAVSTPTTPTALVPVEVGITKELAMPWGTTTPDATFVFTITQMENISSGMPGANATVPLVPPTVTIPNMTVIFEEGDGPNRRADYVGLSATPPRAVPDHFSDVQVAHRVGNASIANLLQGVTWPGVGVYSFLIQEVRPTVSTNVFADYEFMTYDTTVFMLTVRVGLCPVTGEYVPTQSYAWPGTPGTDDQIIWDGKLYHIVPGEPGTEPYYWEVDPSQIRFVNTFYREVDRGQGEDEVPSFAVTKLIRDTAATDAYADRQLYFDFDVTLTIPALALAPIAYEPFAGPVVGYIFNADGTPAMNDATPPVQRTVAFTGTMPLLVSETFGLRHGQTMEIPTLPGGTLFTVTERQHPDYYVYNVEVRIGGVAVSPAYVAPGLAGVGDDFQVGGAGNRYIVDAVDEDGVVEINDATFTNALRYVPITGLIVGSMPVLVALIVATLILAMMVASRSRKRIEYLPVAV
ncbi:MAG: hypothetical protein FWE48_02245 [Coriobacteriia bacterium]|nr:hypothetical protein [Coriobacteriia bacterium]